VVETVDVYRGGTLLLQRAVLRQLRIAPDGAVAGQIRAESSAGDMDLMPAAGEAPLHFALPDGRVVEFRIFQAATNSGGWAKLNGQIRTLPPQKPAC
jgi:hypothetical protein